MPERGSLALRPGFGVLSFVVLIRDGDLPHRACGAETLTEAELVDRCRRADRDAQRELYARTHQRIYRVLLRMTRDEDAAFDLAQETYIRAFARIDQFDGRSAVSTWLYRIAVTEALQHLRREKRRNSRLREAAENAPQPPAQMGLGRHADRLDVRDALDSLDDDDRLILLLRYQEDLDYNVIAEITGCAPGTVASRLHRARHRLREILDPGYGTREETSAEQHQKQ